MSYQELDKYYIDKYKRANEPGGEYDCLFWMFIIGVPVCAILLAISYILEIWHE